MRALTLPLLGILALAGGAIYSYLQPSAQAPAPIQAVALEQPATTGAESGSGRFHIVSEDSQARFVIDEVLQGSPKTVVGSTNQVAGHIAADPSGPDPAQSGSIVVDARSFATDSSQRDRAIQNFVLRTASNPYITFVPTSLLGLPSDLAVGRAVPLQIVGDLTIGGVTRPATFDVTVTPEASDRLVGSASTTIRYADWGISIPQVPLVASVSDTVLLELDFAAVAA